MKQERSMAKKTATGKKQEFVWTDDESELLLSVTLQFKAQKSAEEIDWESVRSKYNDIFMLFREALPATPGEACGKDYPHECDAVHKLTLSTKFKKIFESSFSSGLWSAKWAWKSCHAIF